MCPIPDEWDKHVAEFFGAVATAQEYRTVLNSMTKPRIRAAETFAIRWAQHAVRENSPMLLASALLAGSVREPVFPGWDDATYSIAAVIRAIEVASWNPDEVSDLVEGVLDSSRLDRFVRMMGYETPILEVAGLSERFGPEGWQIL